ncbi:N-acetylglucosamine-6-phosphate deacetylase [Sinomonas susongensis]|uniref:N-acetylglucosamine-6-phosphate deacetylase n=1 Tax=Sinomonas susongensis TaxID=1324851 RepID=UPI00110952AA|nr:amidohydrolase family protein [Sinomonas susongensis]
MMARHVRGKDPHSGTTLEVAYDDTRIVSVTDLGVPADAELPYIAPGFIDGQVNGYRGLDINGEDITPEAVMDITGELAKKGVTSWVPTIVTAPEEAIVNALQVISSAREKDPITHAAVPCVHIEGPFISDQDGPRGVHDAQWVRPLDAQEVQRWKRASRLVGIVTVSPHTADAMRQIARMRALGVEVAIGHTHATPEQVSEAVDAGATLSTHLGNGISTTIPRHPNVLWTQLADDRLTAGLIADGHHLPPEALKVMLRAKGTERAYLVSDATALAGKEPGRYETPVGGTVDLSENGRLSYVGTQLLAGAAADLASGFRFVLAEVGLALDEALKLVTSTPARVIPSTRPGLGHLMPGAPADLVLLGSSEASLGQVVGAVQSGRWVAGGPE